MELKYKSLFFSILSIVLLPATAQNNWNWPEDEELADQAKEKQAYYRIQMQLEDQNATFQTLTWLYNNNPELNPGIYIDGVKTIQAILKIEEDKARITQLEDSVMWMFDQRIKYFGKEAEVMDRKAYEAFKMFYRRPAKYPLLKELYAKAYELNSNDLSRFNFIPWMTLAKFYFERKPAEMTAEEVLDIHAKISSAIEFQMANGGNAGKLKKDQDKADAFLSSLDGVLSCDFIANNLVPKMKADPSDLNNAKKIFSYSLQAKCSNESWFLEAAELVYDSDPSFNLAKALGDKYIGSKEYSKSLEFYEKAAELAQSEEDQFELLLSRANIQSKMGNKMSARSLAREASSMFPKESEPYNIIGNLYYSSFNDCKGGESKVIDRAVFIAAYEMYRRAGNLPQMEACKEQFPSIEEIFNENYEEGQEVTLGCWINTAVPLQRRS
ncbi:MAG: hypothetical protein AAGA85_24215 [Bacteroidota bacterium]